MIRINLLPVRAAKKKESAKQQLSILVFCMLLVVGVGLAVYTVMLAKISATKDAIERSELELRQLKTKIGEIDNLKKLQADVKKKLDVLDQLRKEKTGPASRLAKLSDITPDKLWLTGYSETSGKVKIDGLAYNEDLIATFLRNLQDSGHYTGVELGVSEQKDIAGVRLKRFEVSCNLKSFAKEALPAAK